MSFGSSNRAERLEAICLAVQRLRLESGETDVAVARELGTSVVQFKRCLDPQELRHFALADLVPLERAYPGLFVGFARELGYRLVPADAPSGRRPVCEAAAAALRTSSAACAEVLEAIADGVISTRERAHLRQALDEQRKAMATLEASLEGTGTA